MRRKTIVAIGLVCLLGAVGLAIEEETSDGRIWFGLSGSTFGLFFPDLAAVDAFLIDAGFGGFGDAMLFTGGRGRGGVLHGLSLGGIGWGGEARSAAGNRYAELAIGFGGGVAVVRRRRREEETWRETRSSTGCCGGSRSDSSATRSRRAK